MNSGSLNAGSGSANRENKKQFLSFFANKLKSKHNDGGSRNNNGDNTSFFKSNNVYGESND